KAALFQSHSNQISGGSKSVIQPGENLITGHCRFGRSKQLVEFAQANRKRGPKPFLFEPHHLFDEAALNFEFRISPAHHFDNEISYLIEKSVLEVQSVTAL